VIISGRLRSDWKMVSSDAQAACEFVRSKPLSGLPIFRLFSLWIWLRITRRRFRFAAVLSTRSHATRRAGVAAGLAHALAPIGRPAARKQTLTSGLP